MLSARVSRPRANPPLRVAALRPLSAPGFDLRCLALDYKKKTT